MFKDHFAVPIRLWSQICQRVNGFYWCEDCYGEGVERRRQSKGLVDDTKTEEKCESTLQVYSKQISGFDS